MKQMRWSTAIIILAGLALVGAVVLVTIFRPWATAQRPFSPAQTATASSPPTLTPRPEKFRGDWALRDVETQLALGPRTPGSESHAALIRWIQTEAEAAGWKVELQKAEMLGHQVTNVIAKRGSGKPWIILGSHFDARMQADQDPDPARQNQPVPAANDGASSTAVLLELARTLPQETPGEVWLAFFDAEDQGDLPGWDWILGSRALANSLTGKPDAVVIVDMVGDAVLNIYRERNSNAELTNEIWEQAEALGYGGLFINQPKYAMMDDHTPFLEKGIPAVDIIDFDYPSWHTTGDTLDKLSAESLEAVGETLRQWVMNKH